MSPLALNLKHIRISHPFTTSNALWLSVVGCIVFTGLLLLGNIYNDDHILSSRLHVVWQVVLNLILLWVLFVFNFSIMKRDWARRKALLAAGFGTFGITLGCTCAAQAIRIWIYHETLDNGFLWFDIAKDLVLAATAFLISVLLSNVTRRQQIEIENEHLRAENLLIRYQSLENQVDPHFLFNSLNTLDGLIGLEDDKAHQYLHQLAASYRYIMRQTKHVTLSEELEFAQSYINMMAIRYGGNLQISQHIDPRCLDMAIVPISLQLLIENAIKHNVVSDHHPLAISIATQDDTVVVSNTLQPKSGPTQGDGIGLDNLNQRCQLLFQRNIDIRQSDTQFAVAIPLIPQ